MTDDTALHDQVGALAQELARHEAVAHLPGDDPKQDGVIRDGGYLCACGAVFGVREFVPTGRRREREPRLIGPSKDEHVAEAVVEFLSADR